MTTQDAILNKVIAQYKQAVKNVNDAVNADADDAEIEKLEDVEQVAYDAFYAICIKMTPSKILSTLTEPQKKSLVARMADKYIFA